MNKIKKSLSVLLTTAMILTLVPVSAFAVEPTLTNPVTYTQTDTSKEVKFTLDLGKYTDLKTGSALFQLDGAKLATGAGVATVTAVQGTTTHTTPALAFVNTSDNALAGGEQFFNLKVNSDIPANNINDLVVVVSLKLNFSDADGDVKLIVRDNGTGIGDSDKVIATDLVPEAKDMEIRVANKDQKIGPAGGTLSKITILDLGKLSATTSENALVVSLPSGLIFSTATKVETGTGSPSVSYSTDKDELIIKNINKTTSYITIDPFVIQQASRSASNGPITAGFELKVNNKNVSSQDLVVGQLVEYGITLTAVEQGKKEVPTLSKGLAKTVEVTLDAVDGTLSNGQVIDFTVEGAQIVYGKLQATEPTGIILTPSKSAGTKDENKVSGYEIYADSKFAVRTNKYDVQKIKLVFDIVAAPGAKDVTITASTNRVEDQKIELAKAVPALKATVVHRTVVGDKVTNLPEILLTEPSANTLQKGDKIYLTLNYPGSGTDKGQNLAFNDAKSISVTATNDLKIDTATLDKEENVLILTVGSRSYNNPGTIKLANVQGFITNKAIKGEVKLEVKVNDAVEDEVSYVTLSDSLSGAKTQFVIGSTAYLSNGAPKTLVTAPYIKGTGFTMLPVRALGESLGLTANWNNATKTATFASEGKVAVVKIGESTITVNGMKLALNAPAEIKDGSTMIELRSLANAFEVTLDWDNATKTVTVN